MIFPKSKCSRCGQIRELMVSNNPIVAPICFDCIKKELIYDNLEHADYFCRSYNINFRPEIWLKISNAAKEDVFREYSAAFFEDKSIKNLHYNATTSDV